MDKIKIGVIGCGYWGPNYVRVFNQLPTSKIIWCCDLEDSKLKAITQMFPLTRITNNYMDILNDPEVIAVCVSTPASTHYEIAKKSLLLGKHVLVEKPMTLVVNNAQELCRIAEKESKILMVGHVYEYHPCIEELKDHIKNGELGDIHYLHSVRTGLGPIRKDVNTLWDLAPHDISILLYLLEKKPVWVSAIGQAYIQKGIEDVVFLNLLFPKNILASVHVSWLDPIKVRKLTVVGSRKMAIFDDVENFERFKIFDKGFSLEEPYSHSYGEFRLRLREGDIYIPKTDATEPLKIECAHFLDCIREERIPKTDGEKGREVVAILEAAQASLSNNGVPMDVEY